MLSWEWRCSWSSADRRCSNCIWVINNFIAYWGATYIRGFTVNDCSDSLMQTYCGIASDWRYHSLALSHWFEIWLAWFPGSLGGGSSVPEGCRGGQDSSAALPQQTEDLLQRLPQKVRLIVCWVLGLRPEQNNHLFADCIFKWISLNDNFYMLIYLDVSWNNSVYNGVAVICFCYHPFAY